MTVKVHVIFYSMYGHVYQMAESAAAGAREIDGAEVSLFQVQELIPPEALERTKSRMVLGRQPHSFPAMGMGS